MAASPVELFTGDGVEDEYTYVFEVPGNYSAVLVKTRPLTDENFSLLTLNLQYSHNASTKTITFLAGFIPATGTVIRIERFSNRDRQIDYVGGSTIEERNLDNDPNRLTMVTQEIEAGLLDALRRSDDRESWNGEGLPSENCLDATEPDGWVTLQQLEQAVGAGGLPTSSSEGLVFTFTGNGTQTQYELDDVEGIHKELVNVFVESVYQSADGSVYDILRKTSTGYPTFGDDDDYLEFATAPPAGAKIEVRTLKGSFFTEVPDFSITTEKLADNAVTLSKINLGTGLSDRFMIIDSVGDPTARRIGAEDFQALTADENATLPNDFSTLLQTLRLDQFVKPDNPVDFNNKRLTTLGAATAQTDAISKGLMEDHVSEELAALAGVSLQVHQANIDPVDWVLTFQTNQITAPMILNLPFKPNMFILQVVQRIDFGDADELRMITWMHIRLGPHMDGRYWRMLSLDAENNEFRINIKHDESQNNVLLRRKTGQSVGQNDWAFGVSNTPTEISYLALKF